jgi:hypothetical protein
MKNRPVGVTILVAIDFLGVAFYLVLAMLFLANREQGTKLLEGMSGAGTGPAPLLRTGAFLPFYFLTMAIFTGVLGWGLWKLKNWARIILLVIIGLSLFGAAIHIIAVWSYPTAGGFAVALLRVAVAIVIFGYLSSAPVRDAFRPEV